MAARSGVNRRAVGKPAKHPGFAKGSLLDLETLDTREIEAILRAAKKHDRGGRPKSSSALKNKFVVLAFFENSTRTRTSFELAAKRLGAYTTVMTANVSSVEKGESLLDTGYTLQALGADIIVMRHPSSGAARALARNLDIPVINAGDGMHEHPTQGLLDAYTILKHKKRLKGLRVAIVGDIFHSRVARSNVHLLSRFGAEVVLCGPTELLPPTATQMAPCVKVTQNMGEALAGADVVMMLRVQKERLQGLQLNVSYYMSQYQLTPERFAMAKKDAILMHPGPMNRGLELEGNLADHPRSAVRQQVTSGVLVRMAVLERAVR